MKEEFEKILSKRLSYILNDRALCTAVKMGHDSIWPQDLFLAIITDRESLTVFVLSLLRINIDGLYDEVSKSTTPIDKKSSIDDFKRHESTLEIIRNAHKISQDMKHPCITTEHIVISFLSYSGEIKHTLNIKSILEKFGVCDKKFVQGVVAAMTSDASKPIDRENIIKTIGKTIAENEGTVKVNKRESVLEKNLIKESFITCLNEKVKEREEKFIGREKEINRCLQILCRKKKSNLIIIGESGTGKTSLVEGIAQKINKKTVPDKLLSANIYTLNIGNIVAGTKYRGQFEERMKNVLDFVEESVQKNSKSVIFIDEIHTIVNAGNADGALDASSILKPKLSSGDIQCIGTTTYQDYRKHFLKDDALSRRFTPVYVDEPSNKDTLSILKGIKKEYEDFHKIKISDSILETIISLCGKYMKNKFFPDKAIDVLDEACVQEYVLYKSAKRKKIDRKDYVPLSEEIVLNVVSDMIGIPVTTMTQDERNSILKMKDNLSKIIIGQEKALDSICDAVQRSRAGFKDENKTMGVFLFLGPTGTGKTLTAKSLSEKMFGSDKIIRLDMSEYMEQHSTAKIIGSPPGYIGHDEGGFLVEMVRKKPYSIILLDEIEKAHKDVLNIFLQVFDEGRLTDSHGRLADFRNTIIIMTSNIATSKVGKEKRIGFSVPDEVKEQKDVESFLLNKVQDYFSPEFFNRIDDVIIFNKLTKKDIGSILELEILKVKNRAKSSGYHLEISDEAKEFIAEQGYNENFGARPMSRAIKNLLETPIAKKIFSDEMQKGDIVYIDFDAQKEHLTFTINSKKEEKDGTDFRAISRDEEDGRSISEQEI